jgi:hypothetical protein
MFQMLVTQKQKKATSKNRSGLLSLTFTLSICID